MRWTLWCLLVGGAIAGAMMTWFVPTGLSEQLARDVQTRPFVLKRDSTDPVEVTPARWFLLPFLWADFDLQMDVELGEGVELDVLVRQVEPRFVDERKIPFAGRFSVLRLSTEGNAAEGWRTREQALLGPSGGGVGLAPGRIATVWIEARGRTLRANVAGRPQPEWQAADRYGMFAMIVKGGDAVVHRLEIRPRPRDDAWQWSPWIWAAAGLCGAGVLALLARRGAATGHVLGGLVLPSFAWLLTRAAPQELALPEPSGMLLVLLGLQLVAALFVVQRLRGLPFLVLFAAGAALAWSGLAKFESDSREVDAVFGPAAGSQLSEAHAQIVRGPAGLHMLGAEGPCVFLLGGLVPYGLVDRSEHMEVLLATQLRGRLGRSVEVPCPQTEFADVGQQWRLYRRFYRGYRPRVVVLAVDVVADGESLRDVVAEARAGCAEDGAELVLFACDTLDSHHLETLRRLAAEGVPLVVAGRDAARTDVARQLADVVEPLLR